MTRIIAIASGKGGVGKTTLVSNLAAALAKYEKNVVAFDTNLTTSNLGLLKPLLCSQISGKWFTSTKAVSGSFPGTYP